MFQFDIAGEEGIGVGQPEESEAYEYPPQGIRNAQGGMFSFLSALFLIFTILRCKVKLRNMIIVYNESN